MIIYLLRISRFAAQLVLVVGCCMFGSGVLLAQSDEISDLTKLAMEHRIGAARKTEQWIRDGDEAYENGGFEQVMCHYGHSLEQLSDGAVAVSKQRAKAIQRYAQDRLAFLSKANP